MKKTILLSVVLLLVCKTFAQTGLEFAKQKFEEEKYIYSFFIDVLNTKDKNMLHSYTNAYFDSYYSDMDGDNQLWKWENSFSMDEIKIIYSSNDKQNWLIIGHAQIFIIKECFSKDGKLYFYGTEDSSYNKQNDPYSPIDWSPVRYFDNFTFIFSFDGDYLNIYYNEEDQDHLFAKYCRVNEDTYKTIFQFIKNNSQDFKNITWPRHADGTCDYEDVSSVKTVSSPSTNVVPNKTMTVSENLKLRSGEATTSEVLTVMSAGTKVKILELGKAENIDGINSNWVKVEVQSGAKDRDGRAIRAGTVGWCYGGYLK